ncbi:MAG: LysR family transcriptional regulator [Sulfuricellaceae bacterium]
MTIKLNKIDLNLFAVFDAVYMEKNLTRAGDRLGMSQPAVSNALSRLRRVFKDKLFVKTSQGMQPTALAQQLAEPIQRALDLFNLSLCGVEFDPATSDRVFRLAMTDYGAFLLLPELAAHVKVLAPNISLRVQHLTESTIQKSLESGKIDLAFSSQMRVGADFYEKTLYYDRFVSLIRMDHPEVGDTIGIDQFVKLHHILYAPQGGQLGVVDRELAKSGLSLKIAVYAPHVLTIPSIIERTDYISTIPERLILPYLGDRKLRLIEPPISVPGFDMKQIWHQTTANDAPNRWLRALIAELCAKFPDLKPARKAGAALSCPRGSTR